MNNQKRFPEEFKIEAVKQVTERGRQVAELVMRLDALGYRGDYSFEVFNDDYQQIPLPVVAQRARRSAEWLGEEVLQRSVPLPNQIQLKRQARHG